MQAFDNNVLIQPEAFAADTLHYANLRLVLESSLGPVKDPSMVWVVETNLEESMEEIADFKAKLDAALSNCDKRMQNEPALQTWSLAQQIQARGEFLAEFYKKNKAVGQKKVMHAAFTNYELALTLSTYLDGANLPVQIPASEVTVPIDKFKDEILDGKRPFTVLMMDGDIFEVWGQASPDENVIETIDEISYFDPERFSGTFWAWDRFYASYDAKMTWLKLKVQRSI